MKKIIKIINLKITDTCAECPYLEYDPDYGQSYSDGYDCKESGKRIVDDRDVNKKGFPPIPEWCHLKDFNKKSKR